MFSLVTFRSYFIYQSLHIVFRVRYRATSPRFGSCSLQNSIEALLAVASERFPEQFADVAVLFFGHCNHLLCERLREADGENARVA